MLLRLEEENVDLNADTRGFVLWTVAAVEGTSLVVSSLPLSDTVAASADDEEEEESKRWAAERESCCLSSDKDREEEEEERDVLEMLLRAEGPLGRRV